jgi:ribose transport system substrate-binding protein
MRKRFLTTMAVLTAGAIALTGCSGSDSGSGSGGGDDDTFKVIAFTTGNQTPIGAWWVKAVQAKAEENGWELQMIQGDFDLQKMNPQVETAIAQGADAIFDGYTDEAQIPSIISAARDADIPVFAMDANPEATDSFVYDVTASSQGNVEATTGALDEALGGLEGKNIMVIGHDPHAGIRLRSELALKAFEDAGANVVNGGIQKVESPATGRTEALNFVADYLAANPDGLDAVWVGWDDAALGAYQAVKEAGSSAQVTGSDATAEAIAAVEAQDGFLATVEQPWPSVLDLVIDAMLEYQDSGELPSENFEAVDVTLVTPDNAADITPSDQLE